MEGTSSQRNNTEFLLNAISVLKPANAKYISLHIIFYSAPMHLPSCTIALSDCNYSQVREYFLVHLSLLKNLASLWGIL